MSSFLNRSKWVYLPQYFKINQGHQLVSFQQQDEKLARQPSRNFQRFGRNLLNRKEFNDSSNGLTVKP